MCCLSAKIIDVACFVNLPGYSSAFRNDTPLLRATDHDQSTAFGKRHGCLINTCWSASQYPTKQKHGKLPYPKLDHWLISLNIVDSDCQWPSRLSIRSLSPGIEPGIFCKQSICICMCSTTELWSLPGSIHRGELYYAGTALLSPDPLLCECGGT